MFFIQFFSFAQFAYLIFGTHMEQYSTLTSCIYTQFRMVLGDFDFPAMRRAHEVLGPTYFFVFIFLVFFILMVSRIYFLYIKKDSKLYSFEQSFYLHYAFYSMFVEHVYGYFKRHLLRGQRRCSKPERRISGNFLKHFPF